MHKTPHQLDHEDWGLNDHVKDRAVRLVNFTNRSGGGTATKIRLGDRFFLATAAHVLEERCDIRALIRGERNEFVRDFVNRPVDSSRDIGLLELSPTQAERLQAEFATFDELFVNVDADSQWAALVVGYPSQVVEATDEIDGDVLRRTYEFRPLIYFSPTLARKQWPTSGFRRALHVKHEFFLVFDEQAQLEHLDFQEFGSKPTVVDCTHLSLQGVSGGGIWLDSRPNHADVWSPQPKLVGIQSSINQKGKWLPGTSIDAWLGLAESAYAELREEVQMVRQRVPI